MLKSREYKSLSGIISSVTNLRSRSEVSHRFFSSRTAPLHSAVTMTYTDPHKYLLHTLKDGEPFPYYKLANDHHEIVPGAQLIYPSGYRKLPDKPLGIVDENTNHKVICVNAPFGLNPYDANQKRSFIKFMNSSVMDGVRSPEFANYLSLKEKFVTDFLFQLFGPLQIPSCRVAQYKDKNGILQSGVLTSALKYEATINEIAERDYIHYRDLMMDGIFISTGDGKVYIQLSKKHGLTRVRQRVDLKLALYFLGHHDLENHHKNIFFNFFWDIANQCHAAVPGMYDPANVLEPAEVLAFISKFRDPAQRAGMVETLATKPVDDHVHELNASSLDFPDRLAVKRLALIKVAGLPWNLIHEQLAQWSDRVTGEQRKDINNIEIYFKYRRELFMLAAERIEKLMAEPEIGSRRVMKM